MFKMTPNVLRNLLSKKPTRLYPHAVKCPSQCISVDKKAATWTCDPFACVYCGICVEVCPAKCLHQKQAYRHPVYERQTIFLKGEPKKT